VKAGSGVATLNIQTVPGVTAGVANDTLTAPYNNLVAVKELVEQNKGQIAAIIIEPVAGNMGCVAPLYSFLEGLRKICNEENIVFILDEVMTGFRLAPGGAQEKLNIDADLVTYGKIIGGGLPVGAFGGKKEIMEHIAPLGNVYQAGTLSGNPIAMVAGYTLLKELKNNPSVYTELEEKSSHLSDELSKILYNKKIPHRINRVGSMMSIFFCDHEVFNFESASNSDVKMFNKFFYHMLNHGIYLPPSGYESWFLSNALSIKDIENTLVAVESFTA
jgi:glutamate-1-semialdehyde 2,1-aminomutase